MKPNKIIALLIFSVCIPANGQTTINPDGFSNESPLPAGSFSSSIGRWNDVTFLDWGNGAGGNLAQGYYNSISSSSLSSVFGAYHTLVNQEGSVSIGFGNTMEGVGGNYGQANIALGYGNVIRATNSSEFWGNLLMGSDNSSNTLDAWVLGKGNIGQSETVILGTYAASVPNAALIVGKGTGSARGNGLVVLKNGEVQIPGSISVNGTITSAGSPVLTQNSALTSGFVKASLDGVINLTGTAAGISANGTSIFSLNATGKVIFASNRPTSITSTTPSTNSTTGALTIAGGLGVSADSWINGVRVGRGSGNQGSNTVFGANVLNANTTGYNNLASGDSALRFNTAGWENTGIGASALYSNTTGWRNSAIGYRALYSNTSGNFGTAVGTEALFSNTTGYVNTAIGYRALYSNTTGSYNSANTAGALQNNTSGNSNSALGFEALTRNTTGSNNVAVGANALRSNTTGTNNAAVGYSALNNNTIGSGNTATGELALALNTTGSQNTSYGGYSLYSNIGGSNNSAFGQGSMQLNSTGQSNTATGHASLQTNTSGNFNTAFGSLALYGNTTGHSNVAIGANAALRQANGTTNLLSPDNSVYIGANSRGFNDNDDNSIVLGANAVGQGANTTVIGNTNTTVTRIFGDLVAGTGSGSPVLTQASTSVGSNWVGHSSSFAVGYENTIDRLDGFILGNNNHISDSKRGGVVIGSSNGQFGVTGEWAVTIGTESTAFGDYSTAIGYGALAYSYLSTVLGCGNVGEGSATAWIETDPLLELGNKELGHWEPKENRSNAITTLKNGQTTLTNKAWRANSASPLADPPATATDSGGNALVVDGHTVLNGKVIISVPQGDISMGIYQ